MDTTTLMIFLLLLALAIGANQMWIAVGISIVIAVSVRSLTLGIVVLAGTALMLALRSQVEFWWVVLGAIMLFAFLMNKQGGAGPEMYTPQMLMGG